MADRVGNLAIIISADSKQFQQVMAGVEQHLAASQARIAAKGKGGFSLDNMLGAGASGGYGNLVKAAGLGGFATVMLQSADHAIELAKNIEMVELRLKAMTGSAQTAKDVIAESKKFAAGTPLKAEDIAATNQVYLDGFTLQKEAMDMTRRTAMIGVGIGKHPEELARIIQKVKAQGYLQGDEAAQLSEAGFPLHTVAKEAGIAMSEFKKATEQGRVKWKSLKDAIVKETSEGGRFSTILDETKNTFAGRSAASEASHEARMIPIGKGLFEAGATRQQIGQGVQEFAAQNTLMLASRKARERQYDDMQEWGKFNSQMEKLAENDPRRVEWGRIQTLPQDEAGAA